MNSREIESDLEARAGLFKALGHPVRLLILNLLGVKPRHGEELAAILHLNPATISHHLSKLTDAGLLDVRKDQYYQIYTLVSGILEKPLAEIVRLSQPRLQANVETDAYREKVLKTFLRRGRLLKIPAQLKKRVIVLERIVEAFEPGQEYPEREVNLILLDFHEDVATLRRELVANGLMQRDRGFYCRKIG